MPMRQTTLPEKPLKQEQSAIARLEELSHENGEYADVRIKKWPKRTRYAFLLIAGIASWAVIIALIIFLAG